MNSDGDDPCGPGFPIRTFLDQCLLPTPQDFSQGATSFIASWCQGIHQMPFWRLLSIAHADADPSFCTGTASRMSARFIYLWPTMAWSRRSTFPRTACAARESVEVITSPEQIFTMSNSAARSHAAAKPRHPTGRNLSIRIRLSTQARESGGPGKS